LRGRCQSGKTVAHSFSFARSARLDKSALILGIAGQNGRLLTELLLNKNYRVVGFGWKDSIEQSAALRPFRERIAVCYGDLREPESLAAAMQAHPVSEIYNFAAQSQPGLSWQAAVETGEVNALGAHRVFEAARRWLPQVRIFQASSSDMFGSGAERPQRETTPLQPRNPYAVSKTYAHQTAAVYRLHHGSYIACGILFNHESRYRDMAFLSQKVTYGAVCAKLGVANSPLKNEQGEPMVKDGKLGLGKLEATRDWGYAGDYVQAMWLMLQQPQADDFVIGTGVSRSVREMCEAAYAAVGLDWREHVVVDPRLVRPTETGTAVADAGKAKRVLGWQPTTSFKDMLADMVAAHMERFQQS
jgi:GDPmannose 4,6-dehydratase